MLGKRKREVAVSRRCDLASDSSPSRDTGNGLSNDIFRKHFETAFDPLPESAELASPSSDDEDEDGSGASERRAGSVDSAWSGISDETVEVPVVEVIDHAAMAQVQDNEEDPIGKIFQKAFMSSKPPRGSDSGSRQVPASKSADGDGDRDQDDKQEVTNLKHDLDLQRLLRESHLLEQSKKASVLPGVQRHKATDMRLRGLGSKTSLFKQERMPMSHRNGIRAKASSRDALRRREAKENGIVLERPASDKGRPRDSRRDRGVDTPVVGKFRGGTLQLSRKDVASIQGPSRAGQRKRGRR